MYHWTSTVCKLRNMNLQLARSKVQIKNATLQSGAQTKHRSHCNLIQLTNLLLVRGHTTSRLVLLVSLSLIRIEFYSTKYTSFAANIQT